MRVFENWFAARNNRYDEALANLANISCMRKVGLLFHNHFLPILHVYQQSECFSMHCSGEFICNLFYIISGFHCGHGFLCEVFLPLHINAWTRMGTGLL